MILPHRAPLVNTFLSLRRTNGSLVQRELAFASQMPEELSIQSPRSGNKKKLSDNFCIHNNLIAPSIFHIC